MVNNLLSNNNNKTIGRIVKTARSGQWKNNKEMQPDSESFLWRLCPLTVLFMQPHVLLGPNGVVKKRGLLSCFHSSTIGICSGYVQLLFAVHVQHADRSELSYSFTLRQTHWKYVLWIYITFHNDNNLFFCSAAKKSDVAPVRQRKVKVKIWHWNSWTLIAQSHWTHSQNPLKLTQT